MMQEGEFVTLLRVLCSSILASAVSFKVELGKA